MRMPHKRHSEMLTTEKEHDLDRNGVLLLPLHTCPQKRGGSKLPPRFSYIANPDPAMPGGQRWALIKERNIPFSQFVNLQNPETSHDKAA